MEIVEYFSTDDKEYWLSKIKESDWGAGQYLYELLKKMGTKIFIFQQIIMDSMKSMVMIFLE